MKKLVSLFMVFLFVAFNSFSVLAAEKENTNLISCIENTTIETREDFVETLMQNGFEVPESVYTLSLIRISDLNETSCRVYVDYDREEVIVDTLYQVQASATSTSGRVTREVYSSLGALIYTLTVEGTFSRTSQSVTTTSASGSFQKGTGSFWSSTPTITQGRITSTKAYARISGTASWLLQSRDYRLTLMCDTNGTLTSSFSE